MGDRDDTFFSVEAEHQMKSLLVLVLLAGGAVISTEAAATSICQIRSQMIVCDGSDREPPTREGREAAPGAAAG